MTTPRFATGKLNVLNGPQDVAKTTRALRATGRKIAFVPTMGALHDGHRELLRTARRIPNTVLVTSIFVNPLQFGAGEDFDRYPRPLEADLEVCAQERVELVFTPEKEALYPPGAQVTVHPGPLGDELEGAVRPGHFAGVLTVVAKLFNIVRPDYALFGDKDYQQLALIKKMVRDLDMEVSVIGVPTVREDDGLAMSSRNAYLDPEQRAAAVTLSAALAAGAHVSESGGQAMLAAARAVLDQTPELKVDYLELRGLDLGPAPEKGDARLLVAAKIGTTRLIDNVPVLLGTPDLAQHA
ncbi:pantoate--beta-alanine ligase [Actinokineospora alba]|uniref:Pantothenate synthetase n=1 Tax=Actinokineospora alba TaxID=504798 RepID=A0A1H0SVJ0_9PSEU|nr:pantoate--beta-alanine ligase [Actinokineospora alba]TDP66517.1 pantoate--beta-alanine ligase [Actinokineospora alba]SDJ36791.1 pantoate--beta-alanine ligase [Actinokineospora alba]SDP45665.1 pantoate--beta-alanine ligase [Actinokineospora alba]